MTNINRPTIFIVFLILFCLASGSARLEPELSNNMMSLNYGSPHKSDSKQEDTVLSETQKDGQHGEDKEGADEEHEGGHHSLTPGDSQFWQFVLLATFLTICGAFCSGMTVGLLSISTMQLEMMAVKKNEADHRMATTILKVVNDHHLFLVTLLIANAMALESLPLVIHNLMPDWAAILCSTFIVLVVAEIIPQAYCTGPKKIIVAYYASPIILVMIKIFWVLAYPIAKGLDYLLGVHNHERIQHKDFAKFLHDDKYLTTTEKLLLTSTLELRTERVAQIMIPTNEFFMVEEKEVITELIVKQIKDKDYSYILIYKEQKNHITGVIKIKDFAVKYLKETRKEILASDFMNASSRILTVYSDTNLLEMLMLFQARSTRIALVCNLKRKIDPRMESIMYSKSDMILSGTTAKEVEVIGVVFLYQLFGEMATFKTRIQRESHLNDRHDIDPAGKEMTSLNRPLLE